MILHTEGFWALSAALHALLHSSKCIHLCAGLASLLGLRPWLAWKW